MGGGGTSTGLGTSRSLTTSGWAGESDFPPRATGGGISSSLTGFPFLADVSMDCRV